MSLCRVGLLGLLLLLGACERGVSQGAQNAAEPDVAVQGRLYGRITRGPLSPVQSGEAGASPAPDVVLMLIDELSGRRKTLSSDAQGNYAVDLAPGNYRVQSAPLPGRQFSKDLPTKVLIEAGVETRLDIYIDTGLR